MCSGRKCFGAGGVCIAGVLFVLSLCILLMVDMYVCVYVLLYSDIGEQLIKLLIRFTNSFVIA